jgi:hypothetical protein
MEWLFTKSVRELLAHLCTSWTFTSLRQMNPVSSDEIEVLGKQTPLNIDSCNQCGVGLMLHISEGEISLEERSFAGQ